MSIIVVLVLLTAVCSAIMDLIAFYPNNKISRRGGFCARWFGNTWWKNKYVNGAEHLGRRKIKGTLFYVPVQLCDGWHFAKMLQVTALILAVVLAVYSNLKLPFAWPIALVLLGTAWNLTFTIVIKLLK